MAAQVKPGQLGMATPFGELLGSSTNEMNAELRDYQALGVDWVRIDMHWSLVQPNANGGYNWALVDKVFNAIEAHGMKVVAVLNNTPNWVNSNLSTQADHDAFGRFAAAAAARYNDVVDYWEIYNEQNKNGISPQDYTKMLQQAYNAIKAVDSTDVVITGGNASVPSTGNGMWGAVDYLQQMYDAGAKGYFDAVGHHPYSYPLMPSNSASYNGWQMMEDGIRQTMVNNGDGDKQIWMTEFGAKTIGGNGTTVTDTQAADMLREAVDLAQDYDWAGPIMWYSHQDNNFEPGFGLRDAQGNTRAAYHTFKELGNQDNSGPSADLSSLASGSSGNTNHATTGNSSDDIFVFKKAVMWHQIHDFEKGSDKIDLSHIDANIGRPGHQDFNFIGSNWLDEASDLGIYRDQTHNKTYVQANLDADKDPEISIVLNGIHHLAASDFIF